MATVVTGAGGHVGACLVRTLIERGHQVRCADLEAEPAGLAGLEVELLVGDIRDADFLRGLINEGDLVFHLASIISTSGDRGGLVSSVNVEGARTVAEVCLEKKAKRLVHFSSIHAYDIDTKGAAITEQTRPATANSKSAYNVSKAKGQAAVLEVGSKGLDVVVVNPTGVIGPYDYKRSRMGRFFRRIAQERMDPIGPKGFNWVDVRDVVEGALLAAEQGRAGEAYILGGHYTSNEDLAKIASEITGKPVNDKVLSVGMMTFLQKLTSLMAKFTGKPPMITREALEALTCNHDMSSKKAMDELGYAPRPVEDTVRAIYDWYEAEAILDRRR